jgi:hypothetical protein
MNRLIFGFLCSIYFNFAPAYAQSSDWQEYVYAKDGFTIMAPSKPNFEIQKEKVKRRTLEVHIYSVPARERKVFMLLLLNRDTVDRNTDQEILDRTREAALRVGNGKVISQSAVNLGSYSGLEVELESQYTDAGKKNLHTRNRYFLVGRRLYHLMSVAPAGEPLSPDTDRWFQSFHLMGQQ